MRKIFYLAIVIALLVCGKSAHASTCTTLAAGGSIASAAASCGSGNLIQLVAGTYTISSKINWPCGVSMAGPTVPYSQTPNQTAIINGTVGVNGTAISTTASCSAPSTISYIQWNGGRYNPGGQFIYINPGTTGFTVTHSYIHGNNCGAYCGSTAANLITVYGANPSQTGVGQTISGAFTSNITITWNQFGANGDCGSGANQYSSSPSTSNGGGYCNGVGLGGLLQNIVITNNMFTDGDNEVKYYEAMTCASCGNTGTAGVANPVILRYNDFQRYVRIAYEGQINWGGANEPTLEYVQYNSFDNMLNPRQQNFDISAANGCVYNYNTTSMTNCETHVDYNISVQDVAASQSNCGGDPGTEFWSGQNSTVNGNVWIGPYFCHTLDYAPSGNFQANNNIAWVGGTSTLCTINKIVSEDSPAFTPSCSGNQSTSGTGGTITSVVPVLSVSGSVVTINNTNVSTPNGSNPGRDSNTTFWCTGDGTTPTVGGSNSTPYWTGAASQIVGTFTPSSGTARCVGMWGAPNQPYSYASGYGYVPSAIVTATTTTGPTTPTPTFSPSTSSFNSSVIVTVSNSLAGVVTHCTLDGSTPTTASATYTTPFTFTSTTELQCMAAFTGDANSGIASAVYTLNPSGGVATPIFSPTSETFTGTLAVSISDSTAGASIYYCTGSCTPTIASTAYTGAISLTTTTVVNAIAIAAGIGQSSIGTGTYTLGSAPTLTGGFQGNTGNINTMIVGQSIQQSAIGQYSDTCSGSPCIRTLPDVYGNQPVWSSTNSAVLNVSSTGYITCVAPTNGTTVYSKVQSSATSPNPNVLLNSWGWSCNASTVQSITIACAQTAYMPGQEGSCHATCNYSSFSDDCTNPDVSGNQATWTSSATGVGTITMLGGVYTAITAGQTAISAQVSGLSGLTVVNINNLVANSFGRNVGHSTPWVGYGK